MIVSKKSWHYRYLSNCTGHLYEIPNDLCRYVQRLAIMFMFHTILYTVVIAAITTPILIFLFGFNATSSFFIDIMIGIGIGAWLVVIIGSASIGFAKFSAWYRHRKYLKYKDRIEAEETLLEAYFKALKDKVCPIISFKD